MQFLTEEELAEMFLSGKKYRVELPNGDVKQGRVGKMCCPSSCPRYVLITRPGCFKELGKGVTLLGFAQRKTRVDSKGYLTGEKGLMHILGCESNCTPCVSK